MFAMPNTVFFQSTSSSGSLAPPPSWADVEPSFNAPPQQHQQPQLNDVFSGMSAFDPNEKPAQVYRSDFQLNATPSVHTSTQTVPSNGQFFENGFQTYCEAPAFYDYAAEQLRRGSLGEYSPSWTSSEELSGSSSPTDFNGTTFFQPLVACQPGYKHRSRHYSLLERYAQILKFRATEEELKKNAYPMFANKWTKKATIEDTKYTIGKEMWKSPNDKMRRCVRCHTTFELATNGEMGQMGCMYHSKGSVYNSERQEDVRQCCDEADGLTHGCQLQRFHVYNQLLATELDTFVETEKAWGIDDERSYNILAIDCEMVYTIAGPALARLSVVDWNGELVMDLLVKPPTMVIDPNTEYSGLTMEDIHGAQETLQSCRQKFMSLCNAKTILVGHSLESDLKALRLVHSNVVDTSLLFLSKGYKVGLKKLALMHLGLHIQSNNTAAVGHDSTEDARVSLELLKFKMAGCQ